MCLALVKDSQKWASDTRHRAARRALHPGRFGHTLPPARKSVDSDRPGRAETQTASIRPVWPDRASRSQPVCASHCGAAPSPRRGRTTAHRRRQTPPGNALRADARKRNPVFAQRHESAWAHSRKGTQAVSRFPAFAQKRISVDARKHRSAGGDGRAPDAPHSGMARHQGGKRFSPAGLRPSRSAHAQPRWRAGCCRPSGSAQPRDPAACVPDR